MEFGFGLLWTIQLTDVINLPITLHFGGDFNYMMREGTFANTLDSITGFFNLPIGIRYTYQLNEKTVLGSEFMYVLGQNVSAFKKPNGVDELNSKYMRFGINARWRFVQGGVFYNVGEAINYLGFRAGFAF